MFFFFSQIILTLKGLGLTILDETLLGAFLAATSSSRSLVVGWSVGLSEDFVKK